MITDIPLQTLRATLDEEILDSIKYLFDVFIIEGRDEKYMEDRLHLDVIYGWLNNEY